MVVRIANGIFLLVGKASMMSPSKNSFRFLFIQDGGEYGTETVDSHFFLAEAHSTDAVQKRHIRNTLRSRVASGKTQLPRTCKQMQLAGQPDRLSG